MDCGRQKLEDEDERIRNIMQKGKRQDLETVNPGWSLGQLQQFAHKRYNTHPVEVTENELGIQQRGANLIQELSVQKKLLLRKRREPFKLPHCRCAFHGNERNENSTFFCKPLKPKSKCLLEPPFWNPKPFSFGFVAEPCFSFLPSIFNHNSNSNRNLSSDENLNQNLHSHLKANLHPNSLGNKRLKAVISKRDSKQEAFSGQESKESSELTYLSRVSLKRAKREKLGNKEEKVTHKEGMPSKEKVGKEGKRRKVYKKSMTEQNETKGDGVGEERQRAGNPKEESLGGEERNLEKKSFLECHRYLVGKTEALGSDIPIDISREKGMLSEMMQGYLNLQMLSKDNEAQVKFITSSMAEFVKEFTALDQAIRQGVGMESLTLQEASGMLYQCIGKLLKNIQELEADDIVIKGRKEKFLRTAKSRIYHENISSQAQISPRSSGRSSYLSGPFLERIDEEVAWSSAVQFDKPGSRTKNQKISLSRRLSPSGSISSSRRFSAMSIKGALKRNSSSQFAQQKQLPNKNSLRPSNQSLLLSHPPNELTNDILRQEKQPFKNPIARLRSEIRSSILQSATVTDASDSSFIHQIQSQLQDRRNAVNFLSPTSRFAKMAQLAPLLAQRTHPTNSSPSRSISRNISSKIPSHYPLLRKIWSNYRQQIQEAEEILRKFDPSIVINAEDSIFLKRRKISTIRSHLEEDIEASKYETLLQYICIFEDYCHLALRPLLIKRTLPVLADHDWPHSWMTEFLKDHAHADLRFIHLSEFPEFNEPEKQSLFAMETSTSTKITSASSPQLDSERFADILNQKDLRMILQFDKIRGKSNLKYQTKREQQAKDEMDSRKIKQLLQYALKTGLIEINRIAQEAANHP